MHDRLRLQHTACIVDWSLYSRLKEKEGILLLNHDLNRWEVHVSELKIK